MASAPVSFDDLIAPLGRARFLAEFWKKNFLHIRGPKGRFSHLLPWEKLSEILEWQNPPPDLKLFRDGDAIDPSHYTDHMDKAPVLRQINAGRLLASLAQGCSMVMDGIQKSVPAIRDLSEEFEQVFQAYNLINLYAGWGTQNGFKLHWDPQEVFILQLSGRKHWKVYPPTRAHPLQDDEVKAPQPQGLPIWDGIVEDGDMLYLPRGFWHVVRPLGDPSLHLNVGLEMPNGVDFLRWWLPRLISHADVRADMPPWGQASSRDYFARILEILAADGREQDLPDAFMREWMAFRRVRPRLRLPVGPLEQKAPLEMATRVRLSQRGSLFIEQRPGERMAKFQAIGGQYQVSPAIVPAMERLSGNKSITVGELCQGFTDPKIVKDIFDSLEILAGSGVILKEAPEKPGS